MRGTWFLMEKWFGRFGKQLEMALTWQGPWYTAGVWELWKIICKICPSELLCTSDERAGGEKSRRRRNAACAAEQELLRLQQNISKKSTVFLHLGDLISVQAECFLQQTIGFNVFFVIKPCWSKPECWYKDDNEDNVEETVEAVEAGEVRPLSCPAFISHASPDLCTVWMHCIINHKLLHWSHDCIVGKRSRRRPSTMWPCQVYVPPLSLLPVLCTALWFFHKAV